MAEMKSKVILPVILFSLLLPYYGVSAKPVTPDMAENAVKGWLIKDVKPLDVPLGHQIDTINTYVNNNGEPLYYIVYLKPSGYVIVSADDLVEPIIGFADDGTFDPSFDNPLGALVSNDLNNRISQVRENFSLMSATEQSEQSQMQAKWQDFLDTAQNSSSGFSLMGLTCLCDVRVPPLVQSRWDQTSICGKTCYNYYTPKNYPCGCVATAMAQLMRYFEYPVNSIGTLQYTISVDGKTQTYLTVGGDNTGGPYNWSLMPLSPGSGCGSLTDAQRQAIGSICFDAGIASKMDYAQSGSGTTLSDAKNALKNTFNYANAIFGYNNENEINTSDLYNMINPSLDAGSPVILGILEGLDSVNGHAVVCDGYAYDNNISYTRSGDPYNVSTLYHHLNMGWSGTDDAWYNLPTIDTAHYKFNTITSCLYNIFPSESGEIISGRILDPNNNPIAGAVVYAKTEMNDTISTTTNYRGIYAFKGMLSKTSYVVWANAYGLVTPQKTVATKLSRDGHITCGNIWELDFNTSSEPNYSTAAIYYVYDNAPNDPEPSNPDISDPNENGSAEHPFDSIQEAIDASSHGDMIIILQGTYSGNGNRDIDFKGKAITVTGEDPNDPNLVTINCGGTENEPHRGFVFQNYEIPDSILSGVTITGGFANQGGAIYCTDCVRPTITNCSLKMNTASYGGAIYDSNASPNITNCAFNQNNADAGGAIYNNSQFSGCTPVITSCLFYNNTSNYNGGAMYNYGKAAPILTKCTFESNYSSGGGGAIRNNQTNNMTVTNCIFTTNEAKTSGGAFRNSSGCNINLTNCTFFANFAQNGNSLACIADDQGQTVAGSVQILNCIIFDGGSEIFNSDSSAINVTYSNLKDAKNEAPWPGEGNIYADPLFADIDSVDLHLKSQAGRYEPISKNWVIDDVTSPCIDAGNPQSQVGMEPQPDGGIVNMGAYGGTDQTSKSIQN